MKNTTKLAAIMLTLMLFPAAHADLFGDISIRTDEDAYVNITID